jgi:YVTN family beta-propeller protein
MKKLIFASSLACLLAPAPTCAQNAYITNQDANTVSVIDTRTNTVTGSPIPVGIQPSGVAVTPDPSAWRPAPTAARSMSQTTRTRPYR